MDNVPKMIKACFGHRTPPGAIVDYLNYLKTLQFDSEPDYDKIRKIFVSGIKDAGGSEKGPLNFSVSKKTPQKRKSDFNTNSSPKRKVAKGKKPGKAIKTETENFEDDEEDDKEVSNEKDSEVDDEDIIDESFVEELKPKRRGLKEKGNELPSKKPGLKRNKNIPELDQTENKKSLKKNKEKKDTEEVKSETADPYEGYTEAMKEVMQKKLQNGKSKGKKNKVQDEQTTDDKMEGYTDSMKELALKKKDKLTSKRTVKSKKTAPATNNSESSGMTRGNRLRAHKEVCYGEYDSD